MADPGQALTWGPSVAPAGPGTSPSLLWIFPSSAVGARAPVLVGGWELSVLNEGD